MSALPRRFWAKVEYHPSGCWLWTGAKADNGYGSWRADGRTRSTHRTAYEALVGPVPEGMQLDRSCRVRNCCSPLHLEPVTNATNQHRRSPLTHCKHGHALTPDNLYVRANGHRHCRTCACAATRARLRRGRTTVIVDFHDDARRLVRRTVLTESGCLVLTTSIEKNGYARARFRNRQVWAHRAAFELFVGPIPDGLTIDHLCRTRACVNPAHLEPVTRRENGLRASPPHTHCERGHSMDNAYVAPRGSRRCRLCARERREQLRITRRETAHAP